MRRSFFLLQPLGEQAPHPLQLLALELSIADELREHLLGRALEDRVADARERAPAGTLGFDGREVAVRASLGLVSHVALVLERLQCGEDGGVGELVVERVAHLGDGGRAEPPEHAHDGELAWWEVDLVHGALAGVSTELPVDYGTGRRLSTAFSVVDRRAGGSRVEHWVAA